MLDKLNYPMPNEHEIVQRFLDHGLMAHPEVISYIKEQNNPALIETITNGLPEGTIVVSPAHLPYAKPERDGMRFLSDPVLEVIEGAAGSAGPSNLDDASRYFRDRYDKLSSMVRGRSPSMPIEALTKTPSRYMEQDCGITGIVSDKKTTKNGNVMVELEDTSGNIRVLFSSKKADLFKEGESILLDEVISVKGSPSKDGMFFFAEKIFRPDIPRNNAPYVSGEPGKAVFISDVHVGSNTFLEDAWNRFADWLSDSDASYLLIAGDLVDGIGIYPGQGDELTIKNIDEQYEVFASMIKDLPARMKIVIAPGNHDAIRGAEPQPALPKRFTRFFPQNCTFVENPALVSLQGVRVLMYHGRSFDDMISMIPGASYERSADVMVEMLKRRHLTPSYGGRTPIAASPLDRMVINQIPEIFHAGHVHITGIANYRGVLCINTGTWQSQTSFQKQMNITPTPAQAITVDLQTLNFEVLDFLGPVSG